MYILFEMKFLLSILITLTILGSCSDKSIVEITSPTNGQTFNVGDTIAIAATLTSPSGADLHGYEVHIRSKADQTELFSADEHLHAPTINVSQSWTSTVSNADLEIEVIANLDHDGNISTRKITVHVE